MSSRHATLSAALHLGWLGAVLAAVASCSLTLELEPVQCRTDADCAALGGFACTDGFCASSCLGPRVATSGTTPIELTVIDSLGATQYGSLTGGTDLQLISGKTLKGISVTACGPALADCGVPLSETATSDANGKVKLDVTVTFNGFMDVKGSGVYPTLYYPGHLLDESPRHYPVPVIAEEAVAGLALLANTDADPSRATVLVFVYDCVDRFAPGYSFSIDPPLTEDARQFYIAGALPDFKATATDARGWGGFIKVTPGLKTITVSRNGVTVGTLQVLARKASATIATMRLRAAFP